MLMPGVAGAQSVVGWRGDWTGRYPDATPVTEWGYWPKSPSHGLAFQIAKPGANDSGANATPVANRQLLQWLVLGPFAPNDAAKALGEPFLPNEADIQPNEGDKAGDLAWKKHVSVNKDPGLTPDVIQLNAVAKGTPNGVVYAHLYLHSQMKGKVLFYLDQEKGAKLWVNGKVVLDNPKPINVTPATNYVCYAADEHWKGELLMLGENKAAQKAPVELEKGWNRVLFKANGWLNLRIVEMPDVQYERKNIVWVAKLPNWSNAMPIIVGEKIFLMSEPDELVCLNKADGKILWRRRATFVDAASAEDKRKFPQFKELEDLNAQLRKIDDMGARVPLRVKINKLLHEVDKEDAKSNPEYQEIYRLQAALKDAKASEADKSKAVEGIKAQLAKLSCSREVNPLHQVIEPIEKLMKDPATKEADRTGMARRLEEFLAALGPKPKYPLHPSSHIGGIGWACPTPLSDGKRVWVLLSGFGIAACYDLDGKLQWARLVTDMGDPGAFHNNVPVIAEGKLIFLRGSVMRALDARTGDTVWTSTDLRRQVGVDIWHGFGTGASFSASPCLFKIGDTPYVFFNSAVVRVSDGKVLAQIHHDFGANVRSTPFAFGDSIYLAANFSMDRMPIPAEAEEGMTLARFRNDKWESGDIAFYSSPVVVDGLIYGMRHDGKLWVYDAKSLRQVYIQKLDMDSYNDYDHVGIVASLALGGKHVFAFDNQGAGIVVEPGTTFKQVARNRIAYCVDRIYNFDPEEIFNSGPIFEGSRMYLRGEQNLYCIGKQ
jgi:outer membrane protein assembly factor BamB